MRRRNAQPQQQVDASGECRHLYLTRDATCVHCGLQFRLAWSSERRDLVRPTTRNLIFAVLAALLLVPAQAFPIGGSPILASVFLVLAVLFFTRTLLGGFELYARHGFVPGKLGPIARRHPLNPLLAQAVRHGAGARSLPHRPGNLPAVPGGRHAAHRAPPVVAPARGRLQGPSGWVALVIHGRNGCHGVVGQRGCACYNGETISAYIGKRQLLRPPHIVVVRRPLPA